MTGRQWLGLGLMAGGFLLLVIGVLRVANPPSAEPIPSAGPSASVATSMAPSPTVRATPTLAPTPTPTPALGEVEVRAFVDDLVSAIQRGDVDFLVARLHPVVLDRYGEAACRAAVTTFIDPTFEVEVLEVLDQASWDYVTDERSTTIPDAWTVPANRSQGGVTAAVELHFAPADGTIRWFTDCGTPL